MCKFVEREADQWFPGARRRGEQERTACVSDPDKGDCGDVTMSTDLYTLT